MNKKIKVIDLYNLIANEEKLPQRIVFRGTIYNWDSGRYLHYEDKISNEESFLEGICIEKILNDYIEILNDELLEDNTEEIEEINLAYVVCKSDFEDMEIKDILNKFFIENHNQIEKLTKAVNKLIKESEDKQ